MAHRKSSVTWTHVDSQGRVVIPADLRARLGIEPGKPIAFLVEDGMLRLMTVQQGVERAQEIAARVLKSQPRRSLVDELLAERRAEAEREEYGE